MEISVYELGKLRGYQLAERRGEQKVLAQFYELRLGRALTEGERATLAQRLEKLGATRVLTVQQQLSAEELTAWLADPAAL